MIYLHKIKVMVKIFNIYIITGVNCHVTPLRNDKSFLDSICSFKLGLFNAIFNAILEASRILRIRLFSGAANKIFQENLWLKFSFKCFAGSESLEVFSCSSNRSSTLPLVSSMYICSQTHTPSYMTHDGCGFLLFSLKSCLTLFVIHFILFSYQLLVNSWNFLMKLFESVSFLGKYGISAKTNGLGT